MIPKGEIESGPDAVMGTYSQRVVLAGELHGFPALVLSRTVRRNPRNRSHFTVLALELPAPAPFRLRLEPALTGKLQAAFGGDLPPVATGDAEFDRLHRVSADEAAAVPRVLDEPMRAALTAFRSGSAPGMPDNALGRFSTDLMAGTFAVEGRRVSCMLNGTPMPSQAGRLQAAARLLAELAQRLSA